MEPLPQLQWYQEAMPLGCALAGDGRARQRPDRRMFTRCDASDCFPFSRPHTHGAHPGWPIPHGQYTRGTGIWSPARCNTAPEHHGERGNTFDARRLNSADAGPYDTVPVGQYPQSQSPYGVFDMAGQVFEWTATPASRSPQHFIVKGGAWDDLPGVTRAAARHARPAELKHILIGFRCVTSKTE